MIFEMRGYKFKHAKGIHRREYIILEKDQKLVDARAYFKKMGFYSGDTEIMWATIH